MATTVIKNGHLFAFVLLLILVRSASAETRVILMAEADVSVSEANPDQSEVSITEHVLSAGIGRGLQQGQLISYLRFDLSEIPHSTLFNNISIDSGQLRLLAHSFGLANHDKRFLVGINSCPESAWSESTMTWNSRVCKEGLEGEDSVIIDDNDLPRIYTWDVTRSLARAQARGDTKITFAVEAHRLLDCPRDPFEGKGCPEAEWVGFVRFSSRERSKFGVSAVPTLLISHASSPTPLMSFLNSMLAVLSAIGVTAGLYEALSRIRIKAA